MLASILGKSAPLPWMGVFGSWDGADDVATVRSGADLS